MRALILTITDTNFGNRLQNLAVQEYLKRRGFDEVKTLSKLQFDFKNKQLPSLFSYLSHPSRVLFRHKTEVNTSSFEEFDQNIDFFKYNYDSHSDLSFLNDLFDVFITGSDQVFNPDYFGDDPKNLMLSFVKEENAKVCFSPSIAIKGVSSTYKKNLKRYLSSFDALSCREKEGSLLIEKMTDRKCEVLIDPTLLFDSSFYQKYEKRPSEFIDSPYLFLYSLGRRDLRKINSIYKYAKKKGLAVIEPSNYGPGEFLYAISHANEVITNSFHGCVFSFIYHKPLSIYKRDDKSEASMFSRIETLFDNLSLDYHDFFFEEKRKLFDSEEFFKQCDKKIEETREKVDSYFSSFLASYQERRKTLSIKKERERRLSLSSSACSGCYACYSSCSKKAISMDWKKDGFLYPFIDDKLCIDCGICSQVCPLHNVSIKESERQDGYLAYSNDKDVLSHSSSGGVFFELASSFIKQGGYVCGCVFNKEKMIAEHIISNDIEVIKKMCGSKYIESEINDSYLKIKNLFDEGKKVLFTGLPCQCVALKRVLKREYENLFIVDLICHGVGSKKEIERLYNDKNVDIQFRHKEKNWNDSSSLKINGKLKNNSEFMLLYVSNKIIRDSCRCCNFKGRNRESDITIGDFWGIENVLSKPLGDGKSLVILNTSKGESLFNESNLNRSKLTSIELQEAFKANPMYETSVSAINIYDYDEDFIKTYRRRFLFRKKIKRLLKGHN